MVDFLLLDDVGLGMADFMLSVCVLCPEMGNGLGMFDFLLLFVTVGWLIVWHVFGCNGLVIGLFSV